MADSPDLNRAPWRTHDWDKLPKPRLSISEVAELFGVEEYTLRYWEQETKLSPKRFPTSGARWYGKDDLLLIEKIYYLVERKGLTMKGVNRVLERPELDAELEIRDRLLSLRGKLTDLRDKLDALMEK